MKLTKMSLVAALLVGSSAFAVENVKVSGNANVYYQTADANSGTLFDKDSSSADAGLNLDISADLAKNDLVTVSAMAGYTVISTLGLENNFVSNVWGGAHTATTNTGAAYAGIAPYNGAKVENANWFNQANVTVAFNQATKSAVKIGRMELDTPLAFTETWTIEKNTFEAAVLINQDIPDTTVVGAYVGNGNGTETFGRGAGLDGIAGNADDTGIAADKQSNVYKLGLATGGVVNGNGDFATYGTDGAYAFGVINNSFKPLTVQAWYYDVSKLAQAYWIQGDLDAKDLGVDGLTAGFQYVNMSLDATGSKENSVMAGMVGYAMEGLFSAKVAYSTQSDTGSLDYCGFNTATNAGTAQSKLYTEAWWNYGQVTMKGADALNVTVEAPIEGIADLGLYVTNVTQNQANKPDMTEITASASRSFGPLDTSLVYINTKFDGSDATNTLQVYATLNF